MIFRVAKQQSFLFPEKNKEMVFIAASIPNKTFFLVSYVCLILLNFKADNLVGGEEEENWDTHEANKSQNGFLFFVADAVVVSPEMQSFSVALVVCSGR